MANDGEQWWFDLRRQQDVAAPIASWGTPLNLARRTL